MPEIGFDDEPISPVRREDTVTKRKPKMMIRIAAAMRAAMPVPPTYSGFENAITTISAMMPIRTTFIDRSRSVRGVAAVSSAVFVLDKSRRPPRMPCQMIGSERNTLMMPPAATAPAPMYSTYALRIAPGLMSLISAVASGASGAASDAPKYLIIGISTRYASTPPAHMIDAMRGPMM